MAIPSGKYTSTEQTYADGFVYKETNETFSSICALDDAIDMSVSYTTPVNSNFNKVNMGGWNSNSAAAYISKRQRFKKEWTKSGGGKDYSNVNGLAVSKSPFASTGNTTVVFSKGQGNKYYFGKSAQASATIGTFGQKLITDFEVNKVIFKITLLTGWTKAEFDYFKSNGSLQDNDGSNIDVDSFFANPSNYIIRTFDAAPVAYWDGSTWKGNNLSNSPNIHINFLVDTDKVSGICNIQKHHYDNAPGTGSYGVSNVSVYNSSSGNTTEIASMVRGSVVSELQNIASGMGGFVLDSVTDPLELEPDLTSDEMTDMCDSGIVGAGDTLPAHDVSWCSALTVLKYDQYTLSYDVGSSGQTHFTRYNMYFCSGMKGEYVNKLFAYAGVYFYTGTLTDLNNSGATPNNLKVTGMRLGEMNAAGQTTGNWISPEQMDDYVGPNKTGSIVHPDYDPSSGGGGGDDDDPWNGVEFGGTGAGGGGAFCSVYYMTGAQLTSLKNWSNTSAPEGFDMLPSIIGLQQLPVAVTGAPTTVKFLKSGAITKQGESRVIDTEVPAGTGTGQPISFSLGSVDISRRMQQRGEPYLDYDCTIELFLPFAGTFVLDTQAVMGRTIYAEIVIDPVNGTAFAYAWVSQGGQKMPIAYGSSPIAVDLPVASNQWGISRAAFKQASHQMTMNAIKDIGNFLIGLGTFKTGQSGAIADRSGFASLSIQEGLQAKQIGSQMMTSSTLNVGTDTASAIVNAHQLNNTNYTAVNGSFGGSYAEWSQPFTAYVRITRPKFKKPSNFNHTQAVPCVDTKKIGECTGLTICINPDCGAISCTEAEKIMITQALVGGIYAGGGGQ